MRAGAFEPHLGAGISNPDCTLFGERRYKEANWDRFWSRVNTDGVCWEWTGNLNASGYGVLGYNKGQRNSVAHRMAWEMLVGPIPPEYHVDHLCFNRACVNPDHLEPVTPHVNATRARRMRKGHLARLRQTSASGSVSSDLSVQVSASPYSHPA
jgi:hypothetical protein